MNQKVFSSVWPIAATLALHVLVLCGLILGVNTQPPMPTKPVVVELWQAPAPAIGKAEGGNGEGGTGLAQPEAKPASKPPVKQPEPLPDPQPPIEAPKPVVVDKPVKPTVASARRPKPLQKTIEKPVDIALKPLDPVLPKERKRTKKTAPIVDAKSTNNKPKKDDVKRAAKQNQPQPDKKPKAVAKPDSLPTSSTKPKGPAKPSLTAGTGDGKKAGDKPNAKSSDLLGKVNGTLDGKGANLDGKGKGEGTAKQGIDKGAAAGKFIAVVEAGIRSRVQLSEAYATGTYVRYSLSFADAGGGKVKLLPNYSKVSGSGVDALDEDVEKALEKLRATSFDLPEGLTLSDVRGKPFVYRVK